ncbi:MAG: hypothetical protein ABSG76_24985 [Xanthobacteraceae bacterium]|jgi:hypothetical protein
MVLLSVVVIAALVFGSGIAGLFVQKLLPDDHKSEASRGLLERVAGLVTQKSMSLSGRPRLDK